MIRKNNSDGKPYFTQRNNLLDPLSACNVTAMISALAAADWPFPSGNYNQPEDNLMDFILHDPIVLEEWNRIDPKHTFPPNEWHTLLCLGTNRWLAGLNGPEIKLYENFTINDVRLLIDTGGVAVLSGKFETEKGTIGHVVPAPGYQMADDVSVSALEIDDTYGDYHTKYTRQNGDNIVLPVDEFLSRIRSYGEPGKLAHAVPFYKEIEK